ncbi:MAG: N-acetyltransferase family protein [Bacillota bacterium]
MIKTIKPNFYLKHAEEQDIPVILSFIKKLAVYEKMLDEVIATEASLKESLFTKKKAEVVLAYEAHTPIGFMLFFESYSTFLSRANIFLEDIFIDEGKRGQGYGKIMFEYLAYITTKRGAKRLEWLCLNWNTSSIEFYKKLGAKPLDDWTMFRLKDKALNQLAKSFDI